MDTATIQKINNLAKELLNKRIAATSDEAFQKAQITILGEKQVNKEMEEQYTNELKFLSRKISEIDEKIRGIKQDIKDIVDEIIKLRSQSSARVEVKKDIVKEEVKEEPAKKVSKEEQRELKEPSHDVSIEKIFYYGKK